jgi:protein-disulfide isomerase
MQNHKLETEIASLRRKAVNDLVGKRVLEREARRQGISVEALLAREVDAKVPAPTEAEVTTLLERRRREVGITPEQEPTMRERLKQYLVQQKNAQQRERYVGELRRAASVEMAIPEPRALRVFVPTDGEPTLGPATAPVTIVEFSDFQCPFCQRVQPTLKTLLRDYPDKVRLVYRDFPLPQLHREAKKAAEAARCAGEQGKFWEYHDLLYANPARQREPDLRRYADQLGLEESRFTDCLRSGRHVATVERGMADGKKLGVSGTPSFFVNGAPVIGAQGLDEFKAIVERELARLAPPAASSR